MKILILEANPRKDLNLDKEIRELRRVIDQSSERNEFQVRDGTAVCKDELHKLMLEFERKDPVDDPIIVHFCGHGTGAAGIVLQNKEGNEDILSTKDLVDFLALFNERVTCVVMNACDTDIQAEEINKHIEYVIGMKQAIGDEHAIAFSIGFYQALGYGKSINDAFDFGKNMIQLASGDSPKSRDEITEEIRKLLPTDKVPEAIIIEEYLKPILFQKKNKLTSKNKYKPSEEKSIESHYTSIIEAIMKGRLIPFLGSDINLCDRPLQQNGEPEIWKPNCKYPPSGKELATYLANSFPPQEKPIFCPLCNQETLQKSKSKSDSFPEVCPFINEVIHEHAVLICPLSKESLHVGGKPLQYLSQYAYLTQEENLYNELQKLECFCQPNQLHEFIANLPSIMRKKKYYPPYPLIVTTNYDRALEEAFKNVLEPYDLVLYSNAIDAQEEDRFVHQTPDGTIHEIENPSEYEGLSFEKRPVILKLYGTLEQIQQGESLVITEEHYIEYLVSRNLSNLLPTKILNKLRSPKPNILFLGYPLGDWNQRISLHRIWQDLTSSRSRNRYPWWAIQSNADPLTQELWRSYNVLFYDLPLKDYISELKKRVQDIPEKGDNDHEQ